MIESNRGYQLEEHPVTMHNVEDATLNPSCDMAYTGRDDNEEDYVVDVDMEDHGEDDAVARSKTTSPVDRHKKEDILKSFIGILKPNVVTVQNPQESETKGMVPGRD
ncbi:hypothetical protein L6452_42886 [Arctium lappa]|uniref:Uncharacterized protein n=1 Tax=Arctium lappa TaxID=4217 RepID=A0ACB8XKP9_ARCLA|nr:hypothetical protein L6452_42886 [Arctium lappa]